ncbi:MAG: hypothetical protein R3F39_04350 [Myxococcota bacterium]
MSSDLLRNAAGVLIDDDAFEFAIAHETSHAIDHHEGKLGMSSLTTAGWIREGLGDVFGVLRQAYERDPITGLVAPDWYKGLQCTGSGCPCVDSTSPSFAVPNTILGVASPTPTHISEVCFACSENHNGYLISKLAQLMGDPDNSGTHHGVTVPFVLDVGWTYKDLTQLFIDTLVGAATGSLEDMRDGLFQAAQDLTQTLGDADAIAILTMVRAAADAIGLWSVAAAVGAAVPADQDIALASRGGFHYSFWAASAGFLCYHTQACAFGGECTGGIVDLAVPISTGPAAATIGDTIFTVFGGEDGSLRMASLGPNGFWAEGPHPSAATGAVGVELGTNVTPALVEDDGELYLFYKEGSAANAPVRAMRLPFVDGVPGPQWELLPTSPAVLASTGLSVASAGLDIPETTTQARIFVAFGTPDGTESDALVLWEFAAAAPSPNSLSYWETIGVDGETYVKPPIVGRPTVAYFRGLVQVAARVEAGGSLNAVVHARCEPQPAGGCENWHTAWPLEGSGEQRPAALGLADANAPSDTARLGLWSLPATGAAFAKPMLRSKASD